VNDPGLRLDGATRGDRTEATALIVGGGALACMPLLALIDRLDTPWLLVSLAGGLVGLGIAGLGIRWFRSEGPTLESGLASANAAFVATPPEEPPIDLRLAAASQRLVAHSLRFVAIGSAAVLMVVNLGPVRWVVVAMLVTSFLADQVLLRPRTYVLHEDRLSRWGLFATLDLPLADIKTVYWRHYPVGLRPPFPSGERMIFELEEGAGVEFVFRGASASKDAARLARALLPKLENRLRILTPRRQRTEVATSNVSEHVGEQ
jgi:hypothetical protein